MASPGPRTEQPAKLARNRTATASVAAPRRRFRTASNRLAMFHRSSSFPRKGAFIADRAGQATPGELALFSVASLGYQKFGRGFAGSPGRPGPALAGDPGRGMPFHG